MVHGGDIYHHQIHMDFSVNVNPLGTPRPVISAIQQAATRIDKYPEITAELLREQLAERHSVAASQIACGNGSSELFMALVHGLHPAHMIIPVPSFYGYQWAAEAVHVEMHYYSMKSSCGYQLDHIFLDYMKELVAEIETEAFSAAGGIVLFLGNPNNPTGAYIEPSLLREILDYAKLHGVSVILDECFMEISDEPEKHTMIPYINDYPNLWIVRAFTKTFAMPGIRLGYLLGTDARGLTILRRHLPEWNVSLPAQEAGLAALAETEYLERARYYIAEERHFLEQGLSDLGRDCVHKVYPSVTNYILLASELPLYDVLLDQGILIRNCEDYRGLQKGFYRIAVRTHEENAELLKVMRR